MISKDQAIIMMEMLIDIQKVMNKLSNKPIEVSLEEMDALEYDLGVFNAYSKNILTKPERRRRLNDRILPKTLG